MCAEYFACGYSVREVCSCAPSLVRVQCGSWHCLDGCGCSWLWAGLGGCRPSPGGDKSRRHLAPAELQKLKSSLRSPSPSLAKQAGLIPTIRGCSVKTSSRALRQAAPQSGEGPCRQREGGPPISIMPLGSELLCWPDRLSPGWAQGHCSSLGVWAHREGAAGQWGQQWRCSSAPVQTSEGANPAQPLMAAPLCLWFLLLWLIFSSLHPPKAGWVLFSASEYVGLCPGLTVVHPIHQLHHNLAKLFWCSSSCVVATCWKPYQEGGEIK